MKVLVTGANGFIGSHLVELLVRNGHDVVGTLFKKTKVNNLSPELSVKLAVGDVRDFKFIKKVMDGCDQVYHLAAAMSGTAKTFNDFFSVNVEGTRNVMEAAMQLGIKKVVHTSSMVTIKENKHTADETCLHTGFFDSYYTQTKFLGEKVAFEYGAQGLPVTIVNPTIVYGPGANFLTTFFQLHINPKVRFLSFENSILNLIHVRDAALGHLLAMEKGQAGHKYLLGGEQITLGRFTALMDKITGTRTPVVKLPGYMVDIGSSVLQPMFAIVGKSFPVLKVQIHAMRRGSSVDWKKAKKELGLPSTPLEKGLRETLQWYKNMGYITY